MVAEENDGAKVSEEVASLHKRTVYSKTQNKINRNKGRFEEPKLVQ